MAKPRATTQPAEQEPADALFARVRELCFGFPAVEEKLSHGTPAFFVRGKMFAMYAGDGHGSGRMSIWCKAEPARQTELVAEDPAHYFLPPYVGVKGWVGVQLDATTDWEALTIIAEEGWSSIAPKSALNEPVLPAPAPLPIGKTDPAVSTAAFERLAAICAAWPESECERDGWHASFRVRRKSYLYFCDNHHGDGMIAAWIKMPAGENDALVARDRRRFFVPPYLGPRGWLGVRLDLAKTNWKEVAAHAQAAYQSVAPKRPRAR